MTFIIYAYWVFLMTKMAQWVR